MYVIYHSSDAFAEVTCVSIVSLLENNKDMSEINILYIEQGMRNESKNRLYSVVEKYGRTIVFMKMPNWSEKLGVKLSTTKKVWLGFGYNRLFVTEFLPETIDRVLYLDSDTIIEGSLKELWETNLDNYYIAGVDDCLSKSYRKIVEIGYDGVYCNSGVLLINLKKWREDNIKEKLIECVIKHNGYFIFNEQSILNMVFCGKCLILPLQYNTTTLIYAFEYNELIQLRKPQKYSYGAEEFYTARKSTCITHYTGCFYIAKRPWIINSDHPHAQAYNFYRKLTPWNQNKYMLDNRHLRFRFYIFLCKLLPRKIMINIVSFLYTKLRPGFFKCKKLKAKLDRGLLKLKNNLM